MERTYHLGSAQHPHSATAAANQPTQNPRQQHRPCPNQGRIPLKVAARPDRQSGLRGRAQHPPPSARGCFRSRNRHPSGPPGKPALPRDSAIHEATGSSPPRVPERCRSHRAGPLPARGARGSRRW
ncbi:hypothetical protein NDU88_005749 [Pleurodeles waltl]|uniref:Uncharacterized protein n=1 Tax=Pleurodeles waltl TaxID=8319 RepID=A0AAV7TV83_PLEWA|nr:hypothetical protein NDU88_005749 [Pleurodeles waltl]